MIPEAPWLRLVLVTGDRDEPLAQLPVETVRVAEALATATGDHAGQGPEPYDTAMLLFTSGTTGPSKAVVVPWAASHGYWSWVPADTIQPGEGLYAPLPMFHITGIGSLQYAAWRGGRFITRDRFSAASFWNDVRASGATAAGLVGPMTALLAAVSNATTTRRTRCAA